MNVFLSDKDKAKLNIQFLDQINSKSKYKCKNELIYTDQRSWSRSKNFQSCIIMFKKTLGFASIFKTW